MGCSSVTQLGFKSVTDRRKRLAANARERKRMHLLNQAYDRLRKRLVDAENKSKYDVLVQAKEYIQALAAICEKMDKKDMAESAINEVNSMPTNPSAIPIQHDEFAAATPTTIDSMITPSTTPQLMAYQFPDTTHHISHTVIRPFSHTVDHVKYDNLH